MIDFARARTEMVEGQLRTSGVFDHRVLAAFSRVPREVFLRDEQALFAYSDMHHRLCDNPVRYMGAPAPVARLMELANPGPQDVVLDVACATGYTSAILAHLASSVLGIESDQRLVEKAEANLSSLDIPNVAVIREDLEKGAGSEAPFDVILISAAVDEVPASLLEQLRDGGKLVTLMGRGGSARAVLYKRNRGAIARVDSFNACLPQLSEFSRSPEFSL